MQGLCMQYLGLHSDIDGQYHAAARCYNGRSEACLSSAGGGFDHFHVVRKAQKAELVALRVLHSLKLQDVTVRHITRDVAECIGALDISEHAYSVSTMW